MGKMLTIETINKMFDNFCIGDAIGKIEDGFLYGIKATDPGAPSKEVALFLLEKIVTENNRNSSLPGTFELLISDCGYFTFNELLKNPSVANKLIADMGNVYTRISRNRTDFYPETLEGVQELYDTVRDTFPGDEYKEEWLSIALLKLNLRYDMEKVTLAKNITNMFEVGYELIVSRISEEVFSGTSCILRGPHLPIRVFKKILASEPGIALNNLGHRLNAGGISIEVFCKEYLPFLQEEYPGFPYLKEITPALSDIVRKSLSFLGWDAAYENNEIIYNCYIKPIMEQENMYEFFKAAIALRHLAETSPVESLVQIAGATLSSDELMPFYDRFIGNIGQSYFRNSLLLRLLQPLLKRDAPVSKEFIELQLDEDVTYSCLCLKNECINDIEFWQKHAKNIGENYLFSYRFRYCNSFKKNFIPRMEQKEIYRDLISSIDWDTLSSIDNMPHDFLIEFLEHIGLVNISDKTLANLSEDVVERFINQPKGPGNSLFKRMTLVSLNKNLTKEFLAKNIQKFYCIGRGTRTFRTDSNIKLSELVELV